MLAMRAEQKTVALNDFCHYVMSNYCHHFTVHFPLIGLLCKSTYLNCLRYRLPVCSNRSFLIIVAWSVLDFWKIKLEKSSSANWIFSLQKSISKLIFAGYSGSKNQVWNRLKIQFLELNFSKLIFQKLSTDQRW